MANSAVIRNLPKIRAIVKNAQAMQDLIKEHGSFQNYLSKLRDQGEDQMRTEISRQFAFLGPSTALVFLYSVGEDLPKATQDWHDRHK